jgi:hypothetical protein
MADRTLYAMMSTAIGFRNTSAKPRFAVVGASTLLPSCPITCTSSSRLRSPTSLAVCRGFCPGRLLAKYLKKIVVKVIHLHEFHPTKTKVEKSDIEGVVGEFRKFLEKAVDGDGKGQSTILEIK